MLSELLWILLGIAITLFIGFCVYVIHTLKMIIFYLTNNDD